MGKNKYKEIGSISKKIAMKLQTNPQLCRLLKYTDSNPLSSERPNWDINKEPLLHKNILIIPKINCEELTDNKIVINIPLGSTDLQNDDFAQVTIYIDVFTKMDQWIIEEEDDMLRPFKIMSLVEEEISGKRISSIGTLKFSNFEQEVLDNDVTCHHMTFYVSTND